MSQTIDIVSLYPKDMNIYGDSGNVLTIQRRLALYGYEPHVHAYNQGDVWPEHVDMILGGGGQDTGQKKIIDDFFKRADLLRSLAADGTPISSATKTIPVRPSCAKACSRSVLSTRTAPATMARIIRKARASTM